MPKISKQLSVVTHNDNRYTYETECNYNQEVKFWIKLPEEFNAVIDNLTHDNRNSVNIWPLKVPKGTLWVVRQHSEEDCYNQFKKAIKYLLDIKIITRNVIVIFFKHSPGTSYGSHKYNPEHPLQGLEIGLTYCTEHDSGTKKTYTMKSGVREMGFEPWKNHSVIIEDTPINKQAVESIYSSLNTLISKLREFIANPEELVLNIAKSFKALGPAMEQTETA